MDLKNKCKENGHEMSKKISTPSMANRMIDTYNAGIEMVEKVADAAIVDGLCTTCNLMNQCLWEENNKIYCEHYQ